MVATELAEVCRRLKCHAVGLWDQIVERVHAVGIRGRHTDLGLVAATAESIRVVIDEQVDGDINDSGFAGILQAICIEVLPDRVADRSGYRWHGERSRAPG